MYTTTIYPVYRIQYTLIMVYYIDFDTLHIVLAGLECARMRRMLPSEQNDTLKPCQPGLKWLKDVQKSSRGVSFVWRNDL